MNSKIHEVVVRQIRGLLVTVAAFVKLPDYLSPVYLLWTYPAEMQVFLNLDS